MGNKLKRQPARYQAPARESQVGKNAECPICGEHFPKGTTMIQVEDHVQICSTDPEAGQKRRRLKEIEAQFVTDSFERLSKQQDNRKGFFSSQSQLEDEETMRQNFITRFNEIAQLLPKNRLTDLRLQIEKNYYLRIMISNNLVDMTQGTNTILLHREYLVQDAFQEFKKITNLRKELRINYHNELSQDVGGVSREFFQQIFQEVFSEGMMLFQSADTEEMTYKVHIESHEIQDSDKLFYFAGQLLGKACFDRIPVYVSLNHSIVYALLGQYERNWFDNLEQLQMIDVAEYRSIKYIKDTNLDQDAGGYLEFYFTIANATGNGEVALKFGGSKIKVTEANKREYINLRCNHIAFVRAKKQLTQLRAGFNSVIDQTWFDMMNAQELVELLCGSSEINLQDWQDNTEYQNFMMNSSKLSMSSHRFWKILGSYNQEQLGRFLQFCTGSSKLPLGGFSQLESSPGVKQKFTIQLIDYQDSPKNNKSNGWLVLPRAHTCFNRLDLPRYPNEAKMRAALDYIVNNNIIGFGLE